MHTYMHYVGHSYTCTSVGEERNFNVSTVIVLT